MQNPGGPKVSPAIPFRRPCLELTYLFHSAWPLLCSITIQSSTLPYKGDLKSLEKQRKCRALTFFKIQRCSMTTGTLSLYR